MAIFFTGLLGAAAILLVYTLYELNQRGYVRETEALIVGQADYYQTLMSPMSPMERSEKVRRDVRIDPTRFLALLDVHHNLVAGNIAPLPDPSDVSFLQPDVLTFPLPIQGDQPLKRGQLPKERSLVAVKRVLLPGGQQLWVGRDISAISQSYRTMNWLSVVILLFILIVVFSSFLVSTFVVRRINTIANTARRIMETGDLSERIAVESTWDDLGNLAVLLNVFIARIEQLMQALREVTDNIAHDLRTPLTRLHNRLESTKARVMQLIPQANQAISGEVVTQDLEAMLLESEHLLGVFNAILRLSNVEQGRRTQPFVTVSLTELLTDVVEMYQPVAEEKGISVQMGPLETVTRQGDPNLLFQVFANTIDNAVKFTPPAGSIHVRLTAQPPGEKISCCIAIEDSGCGIAEADREKVFDRFFRADQSRHLPGSGLGLSMVRAVVALHGGHISLKDNAPGLRCLIYL